MAKHSLMRPLIARSMLAAIHRVLELVNGPDSQHTRCHFRGNLLYHLALCRCFRVSSPRSILVVAMKAALVHRLPIELDIGTLNEYIVESLHARIDD